MKFIRLIAGLTLACLSAMAQAAAEPRHSPEGRAEPAAARGQWHDGAHGHARQYPGSGQVVREMPQHSQRVVWAGTHYGFHEGVWYSPHRHGHVVVRPPFGIVVPSLPFFRTLVVIGGLSYFYANGVYYRERPEAGYEVVPAPLAAQTISTTTPVYVANTPDKLFVYPRLSQTPERQASDEYECHRWAVDQSGFDPTAAVSGQASDPARRSDYRRAQAACLDGRGYTVR